MQNSPSIILVNTQLPENIGAAARAMMNFGLGELRLVAPREAWPHERAYDLAGSASSILDNARVFPTLKDAVADRQYVYAATARGREMMKPVFIPHDAMKNIGEKAQENVAFLFGPERTGLSNDDLAIADAIITIPTAPSLASLNVGQSVVVLAYEYFTSFRRKPESQASVLALDPAVKPQDDEVNRTTTSADASLVGQRNPPATKQELQGFLDRLERELDAVDFWKVDDKKPKMWLNLRNIFTRNSLTEQEVRTLHGVMAELIRGRGRN